MNRITCLLAAAAMLAGVVAFAAAGSGHADEEATPIFGIKIPPGYRDWRLISVAHEEGKLNDLRAILGNDIAIKAYQEGKLPLPDGTIIARLAWSYVPLEEKAKPLAIPNLSWLGHLRTGFSLWSRTQENTLRRAAGGSLNLTTANPPTRRCLKPASPATRSSKIATLSSTVTHLNTENEILARSTGPNRAHYGPPMFLIF